MAFICPAVLFCFVFFCHCCDQLASKYNLEVLFDVFGMSVDIEDIEKVIVQAVKGHVTNLGLSWRQSML